MVVNIRIPTHLRKLTDGQDEVAVDAMTVGGAIDALNSVHAGMKERICDEQGNVRRFVNIYVNDEDIRALSHLDTALTDDDELSIIPAIAGG